MNYSKFLSDMIIRQHNPKGASECLLHKYDDGEDDYLTRRAQAIYSTWSRVRNMIVSDDANRSPSYLPRMRGILSRLSSTHVDFSLLSKVIAADLAQQHAIYCDSKRYFRDARVDAAVKKVKPAFAVLYDFVLPSEVVRARRTACQQSAIRNQHHANKRKEEYVISRRDVEAFVEKARDLLLNLDERYQNLVDSSLTSAAFTRGVKRLAYQAVVACQLLCGRRNHEVLSTLEWGPIDHRPYQAQVRGILKNDRLKAEEREYTIPLLCEYSLIDQGLRFVREHVGMEGEPNRVTNTVTSKAIIQASSALFGRPLTHTQKRNLYVDLAWEGRKQNKFMSNESVCRAVWCARALSHADPGVPDVSQRYQAMVIED